MESKIKSNHVIISFADSCLMLHTLIIVIKNFNLNYTLCWDNLPQWKMAQVNLELQINLLENNLQFSLVETWNRY